ncbi:biotin transporter BioY [Kocuria coralli]|uniref:Biotin transporter n=1 Tax=Kocuria coralli TaxID=1461025 RepID=A0A5J5L020_9MICC|nr:biotin transporter BioY [Kocuria coralli]KAA9394968.1 biotin transporter BioY [Kocuria coralli]
MTSPRNTSAPQSERPARAQQRSAGTDLALIAVFAAFCAVLSVMPAIPIGPLAVPITLQTLGIYLTGLVLGGRRGGLAVLLYVVVGVAGLPIFAGFRGGPAVLAGPTAGYIVGFAIAGFLTGLLAYAALRRARTGRAKVIGLFVAAVLGGFVIARVAGIPGMVVNGGLSWRDAFFADLPFWPLDLIKCAAAALVAAAVHRAFPRLASGR